MAKLFALGFKVLTLAILGVVGVVSLLFYREQTRDRTTIAEQAQEIERLESVVDRLQLERRVAEIVVTDQWTDSAGRPNARLLLVERDRTGEPMPPRAFEVVGKQVHVDGLVVKFSNDDVESADPLRGQALLLLEKLYGDEQAPSSGAVIDEPGRIPLIYRSTDPAISTFEQQLWAEFWQLADDEAKRAERNVDVAHGVGVFGNLRPDRKYTLTLTPDGNVTLRDEAIPEVFLRAIRPSGPTTTPTTPSIEIR